VLASLAFCSKKKKKKRGKEGKKKALWINASQAHYNAVFPTPSPFFNRRKKKGRKKTRIIDATLRNTPRSRYSPSFMKKRGKEGRELRKFP